MTGDELRDRLQTVLDAASGRGIVPCPICHGTGEVERAIRAITQTDVAVVIGTSRAAVSAFLGGKQGFKMEVTLRLLDWLALHEAKP